MSHFSDSCDRLVGGEEGGKVESKLKKRAKCCDTRVGECDDHSPDRGAGLLVVGARERRGSSPASSDAAEESWAANSRPAVAQKSTCWTQGAATAAPTAAKLSAIGSTDSVAGAAVSSRNDPEGAEPGGDRVPVDDGVRSAVADLVQRVASEFELGDSETPSDEGRLLGSESADKTEDGAIEEEEELEGSAAGEDETKFHVKLSAVRMTNDRMKEKSKVGFAVLKELKSVCADVGDDNERLRSIINAFHTEHRKSSSNVSEIFQFSCDCAR